MPESKGVGYSRCFRKWLVIMKMWILLSKTGKLSQGKVEGFLLSPPLSDTDPAAFGS